MASFHFSDIDDVIHAPVRLATLAYLSTGESVEFQELKRRLGVTDGNLSVHIVKLEIAGYIRVQKKGAGRGSITRIVLTSLGRKAFASYLEAMDKLAKEVACRENSSR